MAQGVSSSGPTASTRTDPAEVAHYHFVATAASGGLENPGDRLAFLTEEGQEVVAHTLTAADPKTRIEVTVEPNWDEIKTPFRCGYLIEPRGPSCKLTVEHYEIPAGHEGVAEGWARTLSGLKSYLETGQDMHFSPAAEATA